MKAPNKTNPGGTLGDFLRQAVARQGMPPGLAETRLLRPEVAAAYVGLGTNMLWHYRRHGGGPAYFRLGQQSIAYRISDLYQDLMVATYWGFPDAAAICLKAGERGEFRHADPAAGRF